MLTVLVTSKSRKVAGLWRYRIRAPLAALPLDTTGMTLGPERAVPIKTRPTLGHSTSSHTDGHSIPARPTSGQRGARSQPTTTLGGRDVAPARPSRAIPDMSTTARPAAASRMKARAHIAAPQTTGVDELRARRPAGHGRPQ